MISNWMLAIPAQSGGGLWLPEQASTVAPNIDGAWWFVYWVSVIFFVGIVATQAWFMFTYRRRAGWTEQPSPHHNYPLELTWSIIPSLILIVMFVRGFLGFLDVRTPPADTYDIHVVATKWNWSFIYPNGIVSPELHAPVHRDVKLIMSSSDVIHSLFISAFRVKQDIVPGRYNYLWFNATREGSFDLQCTEYCGRNHSEMITKVVIHDDAGMQQWFEDMFREIDEMPPIELGARLYEQRGCSQCHALDDSRRVGPGFAQTYMVEHEFTDGTRAIGDENYIRDSIVNPQSQIRAGYPATMPTYKGLLREAELTALVAFIKAQNPEYRERVEQEYARPAQGDAAENGEAAPGANEANL